MRSISIIIASLFLMSCGGQEPKEKETKVEEKAAVEVVEEEQEVVEIKLAAMGESMAEIKFEPQALSVPANSIVKLTFENKSSGEGMLHNFVLVELGSGAEISAAGITAGKEKEFVPNDDRIFAYSKVTNMGETITIEFEAPAKGSYHYICTYPGHTKMIGRFNVQ